MRDDMHKVIVERPRSVWGNHVWDHAGGRTHRDRVYDDEDGGYAPSRLGMKAGYRGTKWFNENLAPLKRWLHAQVRRHWDDVYGELCKGIDRRNTVQAHIFTHVGDFVAIETWLVDGGIVAAIGWSGTRVPLRDCRQRLYVHPMSRLLLPNDERVSRRAAREAARRKHAEAHADCRRFSEERELRRIDGIWYEIVLERTPEGVHVLAPPPSWVRSGFRITAKRQLGKKDLKRYALTNKAGETRPFLLRVPVSRARKLRTFYLFCLSVFRVISDRR